MIGVAPIIRYRRAREYYFTFLEQEKMYSQLSLLDSEQQSSSISNFDSEQKNRAINRFLGGSIRDVEFSVNTYKPGRKKNEYFRLSWREGNRMKHLHIPGGSTRSELANYRADYLRGMISRGAELGEAIAAVKTYRMGAK